MESLTTISRRPRAEFRLVGCTATARQLRVTTRHATEFVDLTSRLEELIATAGLRCGIVSIQTLHTTTAVVLNEHEPLLLEDFRAFLERLAPGGACYRHDDPAVRTVNLTDDERRNGHAHCRALLLPSSASLNVVEGRLRLGRWQRVFLVELDGPREREVSILLIGEISR
jgi:secondary thiamine-phosphate synthase enzyme